MPYRPSLRTRSRHWLLAPLLSPLSAALLAPGAQAATFLPGAEADPPTGETVLAGASPAEPLRGNGIRWVLGPWRYGGTLGLEQRWQRLEDGRRNRLGLALGDIDFGTYVWEPWFVQLRLGAGFIATRSHEQAEARTDGSNSWTGRAAISVFPASRFPFELRADVSDSRASGTTLGGDYRTRRLSLTQGWRPEAGSDNVQLMVDHSQLSDGRARDTLTVLNLTGLRQFGAHTVDLGLNHSDNQRSDTEERTRLSALNARHSFHPVGDVQVETLASWNEVRLSGAGADSGSDVRQISTFATWRAKPALLFRNATTAPVVAATLRWVDARTLGASEGAGVQAVNGTLGFSQEITPEWRAALSANTSHVRSAALPDTDTVGAQATVAWSPQALELGQWHYAPHAGLNGGFSADTEKRRGTGGLQLSHGLSRDFALSPTQALAVALSQSGGVLAESGQAHTARALAHGLSVSWQSINDGGDQRFGGISVNDSLTEGSSRGRFQMVNVQLSQRAQLSRFSSWSANLTLQATRNQSSEVDVFTGQRRELGAGWQRFYNGGINYEHQRVWGIPRLRFTLLLAGNSQPLERRALGDIEAPRERITQSIESRLDYAIGRLDARLSARAARVEGRDVWALQARAQRRF